MLKENTLTHIGEQLLSLAEQRIKLLAALLLVALLGYAAYFYVDRYRPDLGFSEEQTLVAAQEAVRLDPADVGKRVHLATLYIDKKMYDAAIAETEEVLKARSNLPRALTIQGLAYFRKLDYDNAMERFEKVIEAGSKAKWGSYNIDVNNSSYFGGVIALSRKDYAKAAEYFQTALVLQSADADAHAHLGRALIELDRVDEGLAEIGRSHVLA